MKFKLVLIISFLAFSLSKAQTGYGFSFDNYGGIYLLANNPAHSVESKHRWHVNGLAYNTLSLSEYGQFDLLNRIESPNGFHQLDYTKNSSSQTRNDNYNAYSNRDVLLPSVLYSINSKTSVALLLRNRSITNYTNFNGALWSGLTSGDFGTAFDFNSQNINNITHNWSEVGINFAYTLVDSNYHYVKIGTTIKALGGLGINYFNGNLNGSFNENEDVVRQLEFSSGQITHLNTFNNPEPSIADESFWVSPFNFDFSGFGYGGDAGFVYEYRPKTTNRVDRGSNETALNRYKLKFSAAVLDVGKINYKNDSQPFELEQFTLTNATTSTQNASNFEEGQTLLPFLRTSTTGVQFEETEGEAEIYLPMSLNLGIDYILFNNKNYYVNLNYILPLSNFEDDFTGQRLELMTITGRYETPKFAVYLPVSYNSSFGISAGAGLRYGPITIGAAAINQMLNEKGGHVFLGVNIPLLDNL